MTSSLCHCPFPVAGTFQEGSTTDLQPTHLQERQRIYFVFNSSRWSIRHWCTWMRNSNQQTSANTTNTTALIGGNLDYSVVDSYPELSPFLPQELTFFHSKFSGNTVEDFRLCFKSMAPEVRTMFPQVERLLRLCLISPASSCSAERSFSALRRLKLGLGRRWQRIGWTMSWSRPSWSSDAAELHGIAQTKWVSE